MAASSDSASNDFSSDEEDYDRLTDECLSRTKARKLISAKKKKSGKNGGNLLPVVGQRFSSGRPSRRDSSGRRGREELKTRSRNAQRVYKVLGPVQPNERTNIRGLQELGTVLQVFDLGQDSAEKAEATGTFQERVTSVDEKSEMTEVTDLMEMSQLETTPTIDEIDAVWDELDAEAGTAWMQPVNAVINEILSQAGPGPLTGPTELPLHVQDLCRKANETRVYLSCLSARNPAAPWNAILQKGLRESVGVMNEVVAEMRENCPEYKSNCSWSSASSGGSLCQMRENTLLQLLGVLQELYNEVLSSSVLAIRGVKVWFREDPDEARLVRQSFAHVHKLTDLMREIIHFETLMCDDGVGPAKIMRREEMIQNKEQELLELLRAINDRVVQIQSTVLIPAFMQPGQDGELDRGELSERLEKCWTGLKEATYRLTSCHAFLKHGSYSMLLRTFTAATQSLITLQDTPQNRELMEELLADVPGQLSLDRGYTDDEVEAQEWLLPCLRTLRSALSDSAKQISKSRSFVQLPDSDVLTKLRFQFMDLIHISIARMIRLTHNPGDLDMVQIKKRREHGLTMIRLLSRYDSSFLSSGLEVRRLHDVTAACWFVQGTDQYDVFHRLTTGLLNNILHCQTKVQLNGILGSHVLGRPLSGFSSEELASLRSGDLNPCGFLRQFTEQETSSSSRIGTTVSAYDSSTEPTTVSTVSSVNMPNPFRMAAPDQEPLIPENFCEDRVPEGLSSEAHVNPLSRGGSVELQNHPLSQMSASPQSAGLQEQTPQASCPEMDRFYMINKSELVYGPRIGSGSTGQVFKMYYRGSPVAVKIMNYPRLMDTQERLIHESDMHCRLSHHPNIVQFYGQCGGLDDTDCAVGLVMELCDVGSLLEVIREARGIRHLERSGLDMEPYQKTIGYAFYADWRLRLKMACDVAAGMEFLHSREIVHRDLTSYNVVISHGGREGKLWTAKVCDFERSRHVPSGTCIPRSDTTANSCAWGSPEVLRNEDYSTQADVFSMGVVLWEILTLEVPWRDVRDAHVVITRVSQGERLEIPETTEPALDEYPELCALLGDAWEEQPDARPTMRQFHERLFNIQRALLQRRRNERAMVNGSSVIVV